MYTVTNYRTKKALVDAVKSGERVETFQPWVQMDGGFFPAKTEGTVSIEGPHYASIQNIPEAHRWNATATIRDGIVQTVK
jgi:hypothetical protein